VFNIFRGQGKAHTTNNSLNFLFPSDIDNGQSYLPKIDVLTKESYNYEIGSVRYRLFAVLHYITSKRSVKLGHYVAVIKIGDNWIQADDGKLNIIDSDIATKGNTALLLFYKKIEY
jgi:ubiquitin C-terminal hydrolase